jgi:hypothetical protein
MRFVGLCSVLACIALLLAILLSPARAEVRVEPSPDGVRVDADDAPLIEVFEVLSEKLEFSYPETVELDRMVTGSFAGNLTEVVGRLLYGYDYVAQVSPSGALTIIWIRPNAARRQAEADKPKTRLPPAWHRRRARNKLPYPEPPKMALGSIEERCGPGSRICAGRR